MAGMYYDLFIVNLKMLYIRSKHISSQLESQHLGR